MEKTMKKLSLSLFIGLLLSAQLSNAVIYRITRWWHPELQQEVNILNDVHLDTEDFWATYNQRYDIIDREDTAFRIVEDKTDYASQDPEVKKELKIRFTQIHRDALIHIKNVELADYKKHLRHHKDN